MVSRVSATATTRESRRPISPPARIRPATRRCGFLVLVFASALTVPAQDYRIGDRADEDVICPEAMVVVDAVATAELKEKEARRVPVVYRYFPNAMDEVEAAFRSTFAHTRSNFIDAVEAAFGHETLDDAQIASEEFQNLLASFQRQNVLLPVDRGLAATWAWGDPGGEIESALAGRLREAMRAYIRDDVSPEDIWVGSTLRLVSVGNTEVVTARVAQERGQNINKTNFISLPRVKSEFQDTFPADQRVIARYLASFIRPSCRMEADLTRQMRAERTEGILSADRYRAGQVIVKRGQIINRKTKAALDQLREKAAATRPAPSTMNPVAAPAAPPAPPPAADDRLPWIVGLSAGSVVLVLVILLIARRRPTASLLPVPVAGDSIDLPSTEGDAADPSWKQRALLAEQRARKAQAIVRAGLLSQLAQWLSDRTTRALVSQRAQLLDAHQKAAIEMAELEARLVKIQAPLQERLHAYERRIAELEKDLLAKGEENRALTQAKIQLIRKQLAIEREKNRLEFN